MPRGLFSDPREWADCPECRGGDYHRWAEDNRFASFACPCEACGQPPRCLWGSKRGSIKDGRCSRPATTTLDESGPSHLCGQHERALDLAHEEEDWELAGRQLGDFRRLAETLCNDALLAALDLAWAECEMRVEGAKRERRMIWEDG